jgi:hypothetical protein
MPLFRRSDGDPIQGLSPVRRMVPYLMRGRNESVVYLEQVLDLSRTLPFVAAWNARSREHLTVFQIVIAACGKALLARPGLNRFVVGGQIYQRRGCFISFSLKQAMTDDAPLLTAKLQMVEGEPLGDTVRRIRETLAEARSRRERAVDREVRLALRLPAPVLGAGCGPCGCSTA